MTAFSLSKKSLAALVGVHPALVRTVHRAIEVTTQDFGVTEGVRTDALQLRDWMRKTSQKNGIPVGVTINGIRGTGRGNHQVSLTDGHGHAVDLVPYVRGVILWSLPESQQWQHIYPVALAMQAAAVEQKVRIRWGAVWDRCLNDLPAEVAGLVSEVHAYTVRHVGPDLLDGPHFELEPAWDASNPGTVPMV